MDQQEAKNAILGRIKTGKPPLEPLPEVPMFPYRGDPLADFIRNLLSFDGRAIKFRTRDDAIAWLRKQPEMDAAKMSIHSAAAGVDGNVSASELADLQNAFSLQTFVAEGTLAVGEMGAIWVTGDSLGHPAWALLARKLFILLNREEIRGGMHETYASLKLGAEQYGSFFSGPSATADIEAVHITGAQGPLGLTALIYNCDDVADPPELLVNPDADKSEWLASE